MEIQKLLKARIGQFVDQYHGESFRCSAYLYDNTFLPCVIIRKNKKYIDLACKRFEKELSEKDNSTSKFNSYREIVKIFATYGNRIDESDIDFVEKSRFATPNHLLDQIQCETSMSWTAFVIEMNDGSFFSYGTSYRKEFFDLPENFSFSDVKELHTHSYVGKNNNIVKIKCGTNSFDEEYDLSKVYREKPFFICYID